ncbi:unnamed protein product, partial [Vitis vinifera]
MAERRSGNVQASNGKATGAGTAYTIDLNSFSKRLNKLYSHWNEHKSDLWGSVDVIAIATPPASEDLRYLKSSALSTWLLGYEFPETIMVFMKKQLHFLCSQKKASLLGVLKTSAKEAVGNVVVPNLENVIDEEKKVTHSSLMDDTEKAIVDPTKAKVRLRAENVDICYPPIFQSGGKFDLRPSAASNDDYLHYDPPSVIICAIGSRYNSYCSNLARTFLIDANALQSNAYGVLLKAHEVAISALRPGNKISDLTKSAGTGIGLEFRESGLSINAKNDRVLKQGMVFNVSLGFQNLQSSENNPKNQDFSLLLADTIIIGEKPEVVTSLSSKAVKDIAYSFNEEGDDNEGEERPKAKAESHGPETLSKTTLRSDNQEISKEELRRQHQAELARQKNEETARRLAGGGSAAGDNHGASKTSSDLIAYKNVNDVPPPRDCMIQIDQKNEAILLPIYGSLVPFHVGTVRTVTSQQDTNRTCYIRIIFNVPGTAFNPHDANSLKFQGSIYLKEVSFRSKDPRHISEVVQGIKTLRRQVVARESERAERATLVTQEKLQLAGNKFKPIKLFGLWIRPPFGGRGRKLSGTLEAHVNGFRYSTSRPDERVDIMYGNIKHAFFQPVENEMITLIHFHLHNHIMVGTKKTKDVQFYVEVMDRDRKNKVNMDFQSFVNRVNDLWGQPQFSGLDLEFDQPLRELGFHGVPYKSSAFIVPTSSCLVELIETPFLVITLAEIEIVNLERVGLGQKNFDMTIVFKDFKRDVLRIDSIPSTFIDDGGWEFLNMEASDSDSEHSEESDQGYEPSDVQSDSESSSDSDIESLVESEDDEEDDSEEESAEEEGKTWEELEREASNADREKGDESDSEDERKRRKTKAFGKGRPPPPGSRASGGSAAKRPLPRSRPFSGSSSFDRILTNLLLSRFSHLLLVPYLFAGMILSLLPNLILKASSIGSWYCDDRGPSFKRLEWSLLLFRPYLKVLLSMLGD